MSHSTYGLKFALFCFVLLCFAFDLLGFALSRFKLGVSAYEHNFAIRGISEFRVCKRCKLIWFLVFTFSFSPRFRTEGDRQG